MKTSLMYSEFCYEMQRARIGSLIAFNLYSKNKFRARRGMGPVNYELYDFEKRGAYDGDYDFF